MPIKHTMYRAAEAFGETLGSLGSGAAALASHTMKSSPTKETKQTHDSTIGYTLRFVRNVIADTVEDVPILGSVSDWFVRHKDVERLADLSPEKMYAKLDEYGESYDLKRFKELSETAIETVHNSASHIMGNQDGVDITTIDTLSKTLDASKDMNAADRKIALDAVNKALSDCIPTTKLGDIQQKFHDVKRAIEKGENPTDPKLAADTDLTPIYTPYAAADAFKNIHTVAEEELKKEHEQALDKLKELLADTPPTATEATEFKKKLAKLFVLQGTPLNTKEEVDAVVSKHKQKIIDEVTKSYKKAEDELKEQFEGKPATKDNDGKDVAAVAGINESVRVASNASKYDLLSRINAFETLLKLDPKLTLPTQEFSATTGTKDPMMDPSAKKRCLRGLSRKQICELEIAGWLYGKRTRGDRTSDGTVFQIQEVNGQLQVGLKVAGLWFPYHKATPQQLLKDMLQVTDIVLAQGKVPPMITWQIDAKTDELRNKMIVAACLAAHARGVDPKHVILTASGSQEDKRNFSKKNATDPEVMQILQANGSDKVKKMLDDWKNADKTLAGKYASSQGFIKGGVNALREKKTVATAKELNKDADTPEVGTGGPGFNRQ